MSKGDKMTKNNVWKVTTIFYYKNDVIKIKQKPMSYTMKKKGVKV